MPAASLAVLLNFEGQLVYAARSILEAAGFSGVRERGNTTSRPDTFTSVTVDIGEATSRLGIRPEGTQDHAQFTAQLSVLVAVERKNDEPVGDATGTLLDRRCASIRALFLNHPNPFCAYQDAQGVYLQIHAIRPLGAVYNTEDIQEVDTRILNWELQFIIPDSAWPAV